MKNNLPQMYSKSFFINTFYIQKAPGIPLGLETLFED